MSLAHFFVQFCNAAFLTLVVSAVAFAQNEKEIVTWVKGSVHDELGRPIPNAEVFAYATYHGGIRMYELVRKAVSDPNGHYEISGSANLSSFSAILVARLPGHPPGLAWFQLPEPQRDGFDATPAVPLPPTPQIDLVIPSQGGTLVVQVTKDGQPAADVAVTIRLQSANLKDMWAAGGPTPERQEVIDFYEPLRRTNRDGIARFDHLLPGQYVVCAAEAPDEMARGLATGYRSPFETPPPVSQGYGIAVRAGEQTLHQMPIYSQPNKITFKLSRHDQRPLPGDSERRVTIQWESMRGGGWASTMSTNGSGTGTYLFNQTGLASVRFPYKEPPIQSYPVRLPYWAPSGIFAVSARVPDSFPVELTAGEHRGGTVLVRLLDKDGQRRNGLVKIGNEAFQEISVNDGAIKDVHPGSWRIETKISGATRIFPDQNMGSMPAEELLLDRWETLSSKIVVNENDEQEIELRPEIVGYVRGNLIVPAGRKISEFRIAIPAEVYEAGAGVFLHPGTGQFLAGPFRAQTIALQVFPANRYSALPLVRQIADVAVGRVIDSQISVSDLPTESSSETRVFVGMAGVSERAGGDRPTGRVFFADRTTPAMAAMVATYHPSIGRLTGAGMTDATGAIRPRSFFVSRVAEHSDPSKVPQTPLAIAWLPGRCGATILPLPEQGNVPLDIQLPLPISLRGKCVVEGDGETIDVGTITVRAQYEGRGILDDLLSFETTTGTDGAFELAGLTPGTYRVQAALDGIWLSPTLSLTVNEQDAEQLPPLKLTIPAPGGPVLVRLTGERSRLPEKLFVQRPAGPLTGRLWPKFLRPDGAGVVRIPALEAGKHIIRVNDVEKVLEVSPLTESKGLPSNVELDLGSAR